MSNTVNVIHIKASPEEAAENLLDTLKGELQRKGDILCTAWTELHTLLSQPGVVTVEDPAILSTLQDKGTLLSTTWNELYNLIAAYQTELSSRESQVVTAWAQIQNKEQLAGELRKRVALLEEELKKKNESMSTTQATITQLLSQQKKYDGASDDKQAQIDKFQADMEDRETVLSNLTLENLALTAKVEELESHVQNLDPDRTEREETLEKYKSELLRLSEENSTLTEKLKMAKKVSEPVKGAVSQAANGVKEVKLIATPVQQVVQSPEKKRMVQVIRTFPQKGVESKGGQGDATVTNVTSDQSNSSTETTETPQRKTRSASNASPASAPTKEALAATPSTTDVAVESIPPRSSGRRRKAEDTPKSNENTPASASQAEASPLRSKRGRIIKAKGGNQTWTDYYAGSGYMTDVKSEPIETSEDLKISSKGVKVSSEVTDTSSDLNYGCTVKDSREKMLTVSSCIKTTAKSNSLICESDTLNRKSVDESLEGQDESDEELLEKTEQTCDAVESGNICPKCECKFTSGECLRMHMLQVHHVKGELRENHLEIKSGAGKPEGCIIENSVAESGESSREKSSNTKGGQSKDTEENSESSSCEDLAENSRSSKNIVRKRPKKSLKEFVCGECGETFPRKLHLSRHVKATHFVGAHSVEKPYRCGYCGKRYAIKEELKAHHVMHNVESPHRCDQCDARFPKKSQLVRHVRSHTGDRPYVCDVDECDKSFTEAHLLTLHKRRHSTLNPFICERCGATFRNNSDVKRHMMSHTDERRHHCDTCGKDFRRLEHLKLHFRIHSGEKPYKCDECSRGFAQRGDLKKHQRTHKGERLFNCECGKAFGSKAAYQKHLESHKCDLLEEEAESSQVLGAVHVPEGTPAIKMQVATPLKLQTEEEILESDKVENLVIDESQIQNISLNTDTNTNTLDLHHVRNILSTLAQGDLQNQPLTVIQTDQGSGSQVALRIVDNNIQVVPLSEVTSEEAGTGNIVQLETRSGLPQTSVESGACDNLLLQLQDAVATASATAGEQVVHVLLEQGDQVEQEASQVE